ncbi:MFS transporter [Rhodococcus sp. NPDC055024]
MRAWGIVAMLFTLAVISFADKAVLGLTAIPLMDELGLSPAEYGLLSTAFFSLFSIAALCVGLLTNRVSTKWILLVMALLWSVAQLPILLPVAGFWTLLITRVILGGAEGPLTPIGNHSAHKWFRNEDRSVVSSIFGLGAPIGVMIAAPALSWFIEEHGWRSAFGVTGAIGLIWAVIWFFIGKEGPVVDAVQEAASVKCDSPDETTMTESEEASSPTTWQIMRTGTWWGSVAAAFAAYWSVTVLVAWVPAYLVKVHGYSIKETGNLVTILWGVMAIAMVVQGLSVQYFLRRGVSSRRARGLLGGACVAGSGVALLAAVTFVDDGWLQITLLGIGFGVGSVIIPIGQTTSSEISPTNRRGGVLGAYAAVYAIAGVIAPALTGYLVGLYTSPTTGYLVVMILTGFLLIVGGLLAAIFVRPERDRARLALLVEGQNRTTTPVEDRTMA